tara:strand:- start:2470 stop:2793 length:324 start_codon:yes stop_codon:yes gene_type:complete
MVIEYIGSNNVSWETTENGFEYICEVVKTHGTDEEYTEIVRRKEYLKSLNPTDELLNEKLIKRTIEFADEDAKVSAYATLHNSPFNHKPLLDKGDIEFLELFIDIDT